MPAPETCFNPEPLVETISKPQPLTRNSSKGERAPPPAEPVAACGDAQELKRVELEGFFYPIPWWVSGLGLLGLGRFRIFSDFGFGLFGV